MGMPNTLAQEVTKQICNKDYKKPDTSSLPESEKTDTPWKGIERTSSQPIYYIDKKFDT